MLNRYLLDDEAAPPGPLDAADPPPLPPLLLDAAPPPLPLIAPLPELEPELEDDDLPVPPGVVTTVSFFSWQPDNVSPPNNAASSA